MMFLILKDYLTNWLMTYRINLAYNTVRGYSVCIRHLNAYIGNFPLIDLQSSDIQNCYNALLYTDCLSSTTVLYCHRVLKLALKHAIISGLIVKNPCDYVYPPRKKRYNPIILTEDQLSYFVDCLYGSDLYLPVLLAGTLGLRRGEVLGLRWCDFDYSSHIISIRHSLGFKNGELVLSDCKTAKSHRSILLSSDLSNLLYSFHSLPDNFMCQSISGNPISPNTLDKKFKDALVKYNLPSIRFHDLRHTNATLLLRKGIPAVVVAERLGHSSVKVTLDIYAHVMLDMQIQSATALDCIINKK